MSLVVHSMLAFILLKKKRREEERGIKKKGRTMISSEWMKPKRDVTMVKLLCQQHIVHFSAVTARSAPSQEGQSSGSQPRDWNAPQSGSAPFLLYNLFFLNVTVALIYFHFFEGNQRLKTVYMCLGEGSQKDVPQSWRVPHYSVITFVPRVSWDLGKLEFYYVLDTICHLF